MVEGSCRKGSWGLQRKVMVEGIIALRLRRDYTVVIRNP